MLRRLSYVMTLATSYPASHAYNSLCMYNTTRKAPLSFSHAFFFLLSSFVFRLSSFSASLIALKSRSTISAISHPSGRTDIPPQLPNLHHSLPRRPVARRYTPRPASPLSDLLQGVLPADPTRRGGRGAKRHIVFQGYGDRLGVADGSLWRRRDRKRARGVREGERGSRVAGRGLWS